MLPLALYAADLNGFADVLRGTRLGQCLVDFSDCVAHVLKCRVRLIELFVQIVQLKPITWIIDSLQVEDLFVQVVLIAQQLRFSNEQVTALILQSV
jgi:hypothetical protein